MLRPTDGNEPESHDHSDHPDLTGIAGEMRAEWRAEQEAAAVDAAAQWRYSRGIVDWLCERMHAGDRIAATVGAQPFVGVVEEVGDDLVALRCAFGLVEIHVCATVPIVFQLVEHATSGGTRATDRRGFRAALLARDGQVEMSVGVAQMPDAIEGVLLVGRDFVTVVARTGAETIIPLTHVGWVTAARI